MVLHAVLTVYSSQSGFKIITPVSGCKVVISRGIPKTHRRPWEYFSATTKHKSCPSAKHVVPASREEAAMLGAAAEVAVVACVSYNLYAVYFTAVFIDNLKSKIISLNVLIN